MYDDFARRTNLAELYVRRAGADLSVAEHSSSTALYLARAAEMRLLRNTFAATAWLAQGPLLKQHPEADSALEQTLERIEAANRQLLLGAQGPDRGLTPEPKARRAGADVTRQQTPACSTGLACSAEQGLISFWLVRDAGTEPQLRLITENPQAAGRWRGGLLTLVFVGGLLTFLVPWISSSRRTFWQPELAMLWSLLAGILAESWMLALLLLVGCLFWRVIRFVVAWRASHLSEPTTPATAPQSV
jgi:hypothetical protein